MESTFCLLWLQRILTRLIKNCKNQTVLFAQGAEADAPALRRVLPKAEFALLCEDGGAKLPQDFSFVVRDEALTGQSGFGIVYIGGMLSDLPEQEAKEQYQRLRDAGEFVVLHVPKAAELTRQMLPRFEGLCTRYADDKTVAYAGCNPALRSAQEVVAANKPRYAVYGIYKDEEKYIERFLKSVEQADEVVLCDTGTTDKTNEIIADYMRCNPDVRLKTYTIAVKPWRFDDAYNAALALVGGDIDLCINMGMDETLMEDWRDALDTLWDIRYTRYYHKFQTDWGGGMISQHNHDRPHARRGYIWRLPVHEILEYTGEERVCWNNDFWIYHTPDTGKPRASYLPLLEVSVKERPDVWKTWGFLAAEYIAAARFNDALNAVDQAMALPDSDKGYLNKLKFFVYRAVGNTSLALLYLDNTIALMPDRREPYVEKARYLNLLNRNTEAYFAMLQAARQTAEMIDYHHDAGCWGPKFDALLAQLRGLAQKEGALL